MATLHITNGSCAGDTLLTFVDGPVVLACDVLHEGPAPAVDGDAWYELRARFLCGGAGSRADEVRADLERTDRAIAEQLERSASPSAERYEIVLWFEHDLFDQLQLIRTLDLIGGSRAIGGSERARPTNDVAHTGGSKRTRPTNVSLICIDRFPGVERFIGLGQLDAAQLASLYPSRRPVTRDQIALASAAWKAFRSDDPRALVAIARDAHALPFLGDALWRFAAEYPSVEHGLTRTETLALEALVDGPMTGGALFGATQAREPRPFMGDLPFFDTLVALAHARVPLVTIAGPPERVDLGRRMVTIADAGRDVLSGRLDRIALNGIDMWRGGVHLNGAAPLWRWDAARETLVS